MFPYELNMRKELAFLAMGAGMLASTACATTVPQSFVLDSNAVPKPSPTLLTHPNVAPKPRGWVRKATGRGSLIYVAANDEVLIYPERGNDPAPIGTITDGVDGAYGLFVDGRGDLYVANQSTITAYRPGSVDPYITYADAYRPLYIVLDHAGELYAANQNGSISEYAPRHTSPDRVLPSHGVEADGINVDAADNLYVAYRKRNGEGSIEEFKPHAKRGRILGMVLDQPQALQLDRAGNILVVETGTRECIDVFPPGTTTPSQIIRVTFGVNQIALRESENYIYLSNFFDRNVYVSRYPPVQFRSKIVTNQQYIEGVAVSNEER
jgi:hypothetical protein